jgi:hypothetical protein
MPLIPFLQSIQKKIQRNIQRKMTPEVTTLKISFHIDRHLDASRRFPGRNVIIKDMNQLGFMPFEKMLDPHTGELLCTLGGHQRYTLRTQTKVDIMCMTDGVEVRADDRHITNQPYLSSINLHYLISLFDNRIRLPMP